MSVRTTDLCDAHGDALGVAEPCFQSFGGIPAFHGPIVTLRVHEDNARVRAKLEEPGQGAVLVIDGGGSTAAALVGGNLAKLAEANGWAGIVVHGAVRDRVEIDACRVGVRALALVPRKSKKTGAGEENVPVAFAGVTFHPGHFVFVDEDGIVVADRDVSRA